MGNPSFRPTPAQVVGILSLPESADDPGILLPNSVAPTLEQLSGLAADYALHVADFDRTDRLFPADFKVFQTNPLSVAYGACGVAYMFKHVKGEVDSRVVEWILAHKVDTTMYPPGLYLGTSGIAWVMLELGLRSQAEDVLAGTNAHPLLYDNPDLMCGVAGWGITNLHFFIHTSDEVYLSSAIKAGQFLIDTKVENDAGYSWKSNNSTYLGFAHGASGIALLFLYLYLLTQRTEFLNVGRKGLDFDLSHGVQTMDGGLSWRCQIDANFPIQPYWQGGTAGIGLTTLRYYAYLRDEQYRLLLERMFIDVDRSYAAYPGRFLGLCGLGDFLLDLYDFTGNETYLG
jgi:hypothetical protein